MADDKPVDIREFVDDEGNVIGHELNDLSSQVNGKNISELIDEKIYDPVVRKRLQQKLEAIGAIENSAIELNDEAKFVRELALLSSANTIDRVVDETPLLEVLKELQQRESNASQDRSNLQKNVMSGSGWKKGFMKASTAKKPGVVNNVKGVESPSTGDRHSLAASDQADRNEMGTVSHSDASPVHVRTPTLMPFTGMVIEKFP